MNTYKNSGRHQRSMSFFGKIKTTFINFLGSGERDENTNLYNLFVDWKEEESSCYYSDFQDLTDNDPVLEKILIKHDIQFPMKDD